MKSFDLRDTIVPISLLRISNYLGEMNPGETLEIICSDPDLVEDLNYLLSEPAYEFMSLEKVKASGPEFRIVLKKSKTLSSRKAKGGNHVRYRFEQH